MTDENSSANKMNLFNHYNPNKPITRDDIKIHKLVRDISDPTTLLDNLDLKRAVLEGVNHGSNRIITRSMLPFLKQHKTKEPVENKEYLPVKEQRPENPKKASSETHFRKNNEKPKKTSSEMHFRNYAEKPKKTFSEIHFRSYAEKPKTASSEIHFRSCTEKSKEASSEMPSRNYAGKPKKASSEMPFRYNAQKPKKTPPEMSYRNDAKKLKKAFSEMPFRNDAEKLKKASSEMPFRNCVIKSPVSRGKKQNLIFRDLTSQRKRSVVSKRSGKLAKYQKVHNLNLNKNSKSKVKEEDWIDQCLNYLNTFFTNILPF